MPWVGLHCVFVVSPDHAHLLLDNYSESVSVKMCVNKTSHYIASWYRQPNGTSEYFQLFRDKLEQIRNKHKGNKHPSVHVLGDSNFKDID